MPSCSVKWCSNHTSTCSLKSKNGVSFHRFPKDEATCQKWVEAVRHERRDPWWTSSNASRICSIHFKETDISSTPCKVNILAKTAVPICTMVWYDENEYNITSITFNEKTNTVKPILKTYARKKTNMNVLKESKINTSYNCNKESTTMSKINSDAISNMTPCQDNIPQATKLLKTFEVSKTQSLEDGQEPNIVANIDLKISAKENITEVQKNTVFTELNIKSCKEKCCKSNVLVKLNDNTNLILDEDLVNDDTKFTVSNKICEEPNITCENLKKSNENEEPSQVINISNADTFVETITNGNVELDANIAKSYVGTMLKTYLPKRKNKTSEKNIKKSKLRKNKNIWTITMDKGLNIIKCNEINNTSVKQLKDYFNNKLKTGECHKNNIIADLQSNINPQEKTDLCALKNVKKYAFKRRSNLFNRPRIREQNKATVDVEPNTDIHKESNITYLDEFITNRTRIDKIKETDTAVYDEIISELFETSKNIGNVSNTPNYSNDQASNENICIESNTILGTDNNIDSALDKGTNNMHVILDLDTNIYTELNTLMDSELYSMVNTELNDTNTEINRNKMAINDSTEYNENTATVSNQHLTIMNNNMSLEHSDQLTPEPYYYLHTETKGNITTQDNQNTSYNENLTNNERILSNNELQNLETSVVKNIVPETKKVEFATLKKYLTMKSKLDSPSELCTNVLPDIDKNIISRCDNNTSTSSKENLQVSDQDLNAEFNKNIDIEVNNMITSLQNNINTDATKETKSKANSKQFNSILFKEFITNISPAANNSENVDCIINFNTDPNTTKVPEFNVKNISDTKVESSNILEKDLPDLDTIMNLELCSEEDIGLNDHMNKGLNEEFNVDKIDINANLTQCNQNTMTESNQQLFFINKNMTMEHSDHLIPESAYYLHTEMNKNITTQDNNYIINNENIIINDIILSNKELQLLDTAVLNNTEAKKDKCRELKKHLSTKPKLDSLADLCTNTLTNTDKNLFFKSDSSISTTVSKENIQIPDRSHNAEFDKKIDIEVNDVVTTLENNIYTDATIPTGAILLKELITNVTPELNSENIFINNLETDPNTARPTLNKKMISDITECEKSLEKDMPELNTVILSKLNEDQVLKSKVVMITKCNNLNTEMYTDKDVLLQKSNKDFISVLPMPDDQHTVVNEHMDVVDSIFNRDIAAEFDLSLLLSDTPIPDEETQNVDNNSNNSLDGIGGSPNWIQLPTGEMPKIIDDIMNQGSPFFENLDLFDKVNKFNIDKEPNKKNNGTKKKYSTANFEQFEEEIINKYGETDKQCTKNSIAQIEKQLIAEFSDYNKTCLEQNSNICNEYKVSQSKKVTAEKCYNLSDNQTDKQMLAQYLQANSEQCDKFSLDQIVGNCYEQSDKEIEGGNKTINKYQKQNILDSNQVEAPSINQYFEQSEKSSREQDGLIDNSNKVFNDVDIFELSKKQHDKQSNEQTYQPNVGKLVTMEESTPKSIIHSQGTLESHVQEINNQLFEDFNESQEEVNSSADTESVRELNIGKLKRVIFEECYDPECGNDCKNQKHNSNTESHKKDEQRYIKQTNNTSGQPDIEKRKRRDDLLYKRQCYQSNTDNLKKQLNDGSFGLNMKQKKNKRILERHKLLDNEKCKTNYKKIAIDHIPGKYLELRWNESDGKSNTLSQEGCKRKHKEIGLDQRKMLCSESANNFSQQIMECPECGYTTDDNDLMNYKSDVDLRITKPLSLINKNMLISLNDTENNENNKVALESVYAMELAYVTAIQALEKKLKQKMALSEYRLRRVNNLSKINNQLTKANVTLMDFSQKNKV